jgi:hypothetical protein
MKRSIVWEVDNPLSLPHTPTSTQRSLHYVFRPYYPSSFFVIMIFGDEYILHRSFYVIFFIQLLPSLRPEYCPQSRVLIHSQFVLMLVNVPCFKYRTGNAKDSELNGRKNSHNVICSLLFHEYNFDLLLSVIATKYLNFAACQKVELSSFILWSCPAYWWHDMNMQSVLKIGSFSAFTSGPVSWRAYDRISAFFLSLLH